MTSAEQGPHPEIVLRTTAWSVLRAGGAGVLLWTAIALAGLLAWRLAGSDAGLLVALAAGVGLLGGPAQAQTAPALRLPGAGTVAGDEPTTPDAQPHFEGSAPNQDTPAPGPSGGGHRATTRSGTSPGSLRARRAGRTARRRRHAHGTARAWRRRHA